VSCRKSDNFSRSFVHLSRYFTFAVAQLSLLYKMLNIIGLFFCCESVFCVITDVRYVPWNVHEPQPQTYDFSGQQNLSDFLTTAQQAGLVVILRAGPYICGEWEYVRSFL